MIQLAGQCPPISCTESQPARDGRPSTWPLSHEIADRLGTSIEPRRGLKRAEKEKPRTGPRGDSRSQYGPATEMFICSEYHAPQLMTRTPRSRTRLRDVVGDESVPAKHHNLAKSAEPGEIIPGIEVRTRSHTPTAVVALLHVQIV